MEPRSHQNEMRCDAMTKVDLSFFHPTRCDLSPVYTVLYEPENMYTGSIAPRNIDVDDNPIYEGKTPPDNDPLACQAQPVFSESWHRQVVSSRDVDGHSSLGKRG